MFKSIVSKFTGDPAQRTLSKYQALIDEVNALEPEYQAMSEDDLCHVTAEFREELQESVKDLRASWEEARAAVQAEDDVDQRRQMDYDVKKLEDEYFKAVNATLAEFMPHAFAAVREASRRTIGLRHFDVQLIGGAVLHEGLRGDYHGHMKPTSRNQSCRWDNLLNNRRPLLGCATETCWLRLIHP